MTQETNAYQKMFQDIDANAWWYSLSCIVPEARTEVIGNLCSALHYMYSSIDEGVGTLAHACPLCGSAYGIPCTRNYGAGGNSRWPHLERIRRARPAANIDTRQERRLRNERQDLENQVLEQLGRLDQLASMVDNTAKHDRRRWLFMKIASTLGADDDRHLRPNFRGVS